MGLLFNNLTDAEADAYGLVLSASGISHRAAREQDGWNIYVPETAQAEALIAVDQYLRENQPIQRAAGTRLHEYGKTLSGLWASLIVLGVHVAISLSPHRAALVKTYGSAARAILEGELYRAVTSLMIHTNAAHLAGNMAGLALFGTAVCQIAGPGVGWLMILGTGATGNLINAWFYHGRQHLSVGSSTAVFGAVGILAGYQFLKRLRRVEGGPAKSWLPLAGGLALLAFLGASEHADLTAHLFGFAAGVAAGAIYGFAVKRPAGRLAQAYFILIVSGLVVLCWIRGFVRGGL